MIDAIERDDTRVVDKFATSGGHSRSDNCYNGKLHERHLSKALVKSNGIHKKNPKQFEQPYTYVYTFTYTYILY